MSQQFGYVVKKDLPGYLRALSQQALDGAAIAYRDNGIGTSRVKSRQATALLKAADAIESGEKSELANEYRRQHYCPFCEKFHHYWARSNFGWRCPNDGE